MHDFFKIYFGSFFEYVCMHNFFFENAYINGIFGNACTKF